MSHGPSGSLSVELPPEPPDRAVVLDRDAQAWQRHDSSWQRVGAVVKLFGAEGVRSWSHLVVDRGPLTRLVTEDEATEGVEVYVEPGWRRAGYDGRGCEVFDPDPGPHGSTGSERFGPTDGWFDAGFDAPDCGLFRTVA